MGQKVHPFGFRLGVTKTWKSRWFAKQDYAKLLFEDLDLKESLRERLKSAGVSSIEVDRPGNKLRITIRTSRPGIIIGRKGAEIEKLKQDLAKKTKREVFIDIQEVHKPELDAQLVAESIALQLEKRVAFRRAMRKAVDSAQRFGCKGIKIRVSGRLNGAEIARCESYLHGRMPLHTLRADIDYGFAEALTTYGVIGVKCLIYKGDVGEGQRRVMLRNDAEPTPRPKRDNREGGRDNRGDNRGGDNRGGDNRGPRRDDNRGPRPEGSNRSADGRRSEPRVEASMPPTQDAGIVMTAPEVPTTIKSGGPILPPMAPPAPSWKAEAQQSPAVSEAVVDSVVDSGVGSGVGSVVAETAPAVADVVVESPAPAGDAPQE
jgi:small subunit ribosomal protein S3